MLRREAIQRRLLSEADLKYNKAIDVAKAMEAADKNTKAFKGPAQITINKFHSHVSSKGGENSVCYRCGRPKHNADDCKFKHSECHQCGKKGHIAPACRSSLQHQPPRPHSHTRGGSRSRKSWTNRYSTHQVHAGLGSANSASESSGEEYHLHKLGERSSDPINVQLMANGRELSMEFDTGAAVSIISDKTRKGLFPDLKINKSSLVLLTHYNSTLPINMAADASSYGIGAVISNVFPDGTEKPIAFASRSLFSSERNYAQLEKEALSLVFGVKTFHQYLYGRKFNTTILGPKRGVPSLAAARLQSWALLLSAYEYVFSTSRHFDTAMQMAYPDFPYRRQTL